MYGFIPGTYDGTELGYLEGSDPFVLLEALYGFTLGTYDDTEIGSLEVSTEVIAEGNF